MIEESRKRGIAMACAGHYPWCCHTQSCIKRLQKMILRKLGVDTAKTRKASIWEFKSDNRVQFVIDIPLEAQIEQRCPWSRPKPCYHFPMRHKQACRLSSAPESGASLLELDWLKSAISLRDPAVRIPQPVGRLEVTMHKTHTRLHGEVSFLNVVSEPMSRCQRSSFQDSWTMD